MFIKRKIAIYYVRTTLLFFFLAITVVAPAQFIQCYEDNDHDGFGDPTRGHLGYVGFTCEFYLWSSNGFDCNDNDASINPNTVWYEDQDGDRFTTGKFIKQCSRPVGYKLGSELYQPIIHCGFVTKLLDYLDCNDSKPNDINDFLWWFLDNDQDGYIASKESLIISACDPSYQGHHYIGIFPGSVLCSLEIDCNDNSAVEHPGQKWYLDADNDGYTYSLTLFVTQCKRFDFNFKAASELVSTTLDDCNDADPAIFPKVWWQDADGDGYTSGVKVTACYQPAGYILNPLGGDCNDNNSDVHIDFLVWFPDADGDKHGPFSPIFSCNRPPGYFKTTELFSTNDCDDNDNTVYPGATEICDGKDNDCNGAIDDKPFTCRKIIYVNLNAAGLNNGSSWQDAFVNLQDALQALNTLPSGDWQVWVAQGTYTPINAASGVDQTISFGLRSDTHIYGGFAGTETALEERKPAAYITILSGEIQNDGIHGNNSFNVLKAPNVTGWLDGFTITDGASNGNGGGLLVTNSSPTITNCFFRQNTAEAGGGALGVSGSSASFINCIFAGNSAFYGGGAYNLGSTTNFINCTFSGNSSPNGSAIWSEGSSSVAILKNCIIWGNTGSAALISTGIIPIIASYSITQEPAGGGGNIIVDPRFVNAAGFDFRLPSCSPAVNSGTADGAPAFDITRSARPAAGAVDMGAYEKQAVYNKVIFVNAGASGTNNGSNWPNAFTKLQNALNAARVDSCVKEVWTAAGTYYPDEGDYINKYDRHVAFSLIDGIRVLGGFAGTESQAAERNWSLNKTILSGETGNAGVDDNIVHVVVSVANDSTAKLDGFTIMNGNAAEGVFIPGFGGGIYNFNTSPQINNCIIKNNNAFFGGGVYNNNAGAIFSKCVIEQNSGSIGAGVVNSNGSNSIFDSCVFALNNAISAGAGFANLSSAVTITRSTFSGNNAPSYAGMYNTSGSVNITNSLFIGNAASGNGGAFGNDNNGNAAIHSCSFNGNKAANGAGIAFTGKSLSSIKNCVMWGNSSSFYNDGSSTVDVANSLIEFLPPAGSNIDADPQFVSPLNYASAPAVLANLRLLPCSPAINKGTSANAPAFDMENNPRPLQGGVDMGAFERPVINTYYVDLNAKGNFDGSSWSNAETTVYHALDAFNNCPADKLITVQIAKGIYQSANVNNPFIINKPNGVFLGGYPTGGGSRNATTNTVIWNGNLQALKSVRIDGIRLKQ